MVPTQLVKISLGEAEVYNEYCILILSIRSYHKVFRLYVPVNELSLDMHLVES